MSEINSENVVDTTAENTAAENTTEAKITDEEIAQNMTEVGFMANVLKDSKLGGATIKNAPLLGASNDTVEESDEETDVITMAELEKGGKHSTVRLGRQGESNTQTVEFDLGDWMSEVPNGTATIVARRAGESETYLAIGVAYNVETHIATWPITSIDTAYPGYGEAEIRISNSDQTIVKKSARFRTYVEKSVEDYTGEAVTPPYWAVDIISQAADAQAAATSASSNASAAATSAENASLSATRAETAAQNAESDASATSQEVTRLSDDVLSVKWLTEYNNRVNAELAPNGFVSLVIEKMDVGSLDENGGDTDSATGRKTWWVEVKPRAAIYMRCDGNHDLYLREYDTNKNYLRGVSVLKNATQLEKTVILQEDVAYVRFNIRQVNSDSDVYVDIDWAVCAGDGVITLTTATDIRMLTAGEYYASSETVSSGVLTNLPVSTGFIHIHVFPLQTKSYMAILYAANGDIYYTSTLANRPWYKITGIEVS